MGGAASIASYHEQPALSQDWIRGQLPPDVGNAFIELISFHKWSTKDLLEHYEAQDVFDALEVSTSSLLSLPEAQESVLCVLEDGRQQLIPKLHVTLAGLLEAMDQAVYVFERCPMILDNHDKDAARFLQYQRGSYLHAANPRDMEPENLRRCLVAALRYGTLLVVDLGSFANLELDTFFSDDSFPSSILDRKELFQPQVYTKLLRPNAGDPDANQFIIDDQFRFAVVSNVSTPSIEAALRMCSIEVSSTNASSENEESHTGSFAEALGIKSMPKPRNSFEMVEGAFDGDMEVVQKYLDQNYDPNSEDGRGHTALSEAACQGHEQIVTLLIDHGADPNQCNDERRSPLFRASYNGHIAMIDLLLRAGGDPRIATKQGESPFDVAKSSDVQKQLNAWDLSETERLLEERRQAMEAKWEERITSHIERERQAQLHLRQELFELAAGGTAIALEEKFDTIAEEAIDRNEKPRITSEVRNEKGATLLMIAVQFDNVDVVTALLSKVSRVKKQLEQEVAASNFASDSDKLECLLTMFKVNVNARDMHGWTPCTIAVFHESKKSLRVLLDHGADPMLKNFVGATAFDLAKDQIDAAHNVVVSKQEIRQVLEEWESRQADSTVAEAPMQRKEPKSKHTCRSSTKPLKAEKQTTKPTRTKAKK